MKISLSLLFASLASSSAFVVQPPSSARTSVVVFDSRKRQKIASRTKWMESRGGAAEASAPESTATSNAGLMTNEHGLKYVKLVHPDTGASSEVYLYGGVVTSYVDGDGTEVSAPIPSILSTIMKKQCFNPLISALAFIQFIAVRPDAKTDGSKPISGGLSHCWPQVCDPLSPNSLIL
jgi:hypothetical protein